MATPPPCTTAAPKVVPEFELKQGLQVQVYRGEEVHTRWADCAIVRVDEDGKTVKVHAANFAAQPEWAKSVSKDLLRPVTEYTTTASGAAEAEEGGNKKKRKK